jgi:hypothetical protein
MSLKETTMKTIASYIALALLAVVGTVVAWIFTKKHIVKGYDYATAKLAAQQLENEEYMKLRAAAKAAKSTKK